MQPKQQFSSESPRQTLWQIDRSTSVVKFSVKKLWLLKVEGRFTGLDGSILFDESDISASSVNATVASKSIDTSNSHRDATLRSKSFLDVDTFPRLEFQSVEVSRGTDRDTFIVNGALTIKDATKSVALRVTEIDRSKAPDGIEVIYYVAETELNRSDFGINAWPGVIGKVLKVTIDVQANKEG